MKALRHKLKGDGVVWGLIIILMIASNVVVYSAVSNLAWKSLDGGTVSLMTLKHSFYLFLSLGVIYIFHNTPTKYFKLATPILFVIPFLLLFTLLQGNEIGGANASRWISLPFVGVSIQSSTVAAIVLYVHVARYLSRIQDKKPTFKEAIFPLWLPVILIALLILPANFSTAALIVLNVGILLIIGRYPLKHIFGMFAVGVLVLTLFITVAMKFPDAFPNRVNTWTSRVESFLDKSDDKEQYQVEAAKVAISIGGITGQGPGKSVQKHHLPQSSSDFIYAIIVEEFGMIGGIGIIIVYLVLLIRVATIAGRAKNIFSTMLVLSMGIPIIMQALINMAVAVGLMPVTGQPLPFISSGGTSILLGGVSMGIILSVSRETKEADVQESIEEELEEVQEEELESINVKEEELEQVV